MLAFLLSLGFGLGAFLAYLLYISSNSLILLIHRLLIYKLWYYYRFVYLLFMIFIFKKRKKNKEKKENARGPWLLLSPSLRGAGGAMARAVSLAS